MHTWPVGHGTPAPQVTPVVKMHDGHEPPAQRARAHAWVDGSLMSLHDIAAAPSCATHACPDRGRQIPEHVASAVHVEGSNAHVSLPPQSSTDVHGVMALA
jgi:hypothetical protein